MSNIKLDERGLIMSCSQCGQRNRIPFDHLGDTGTCGKCQASLAAPSEPIEVTSESHFNALTASSSLPVLVDFWAEWCGPCRMMAPEFVKAANTLSGKMVPVKVDTEAIPALASRHRIGSLPTLAVFANGREVARDMGARPAANIVSFAESVAVRK